MDSQLAYSETPVMSDLTAPWLLPPEREFVACSFRLNEMVGIQSWSQVGQRSLRLSNVAWNEEEHQGRRDWQLEHLD